MPLPPFEQRIANACPKLSAEECACLKSVIEEEVLEPAVAAIIEESERILAIDPHQEMRAILESAANTIVSCLGAAAATIRILEPYSLKMLNFGAWGLDETGRAATVPAGGSIAGKVVALRRSIAVPSILAEPLYQNKDIVAREGLASLLAVPLVIPSFATGKEDLLGSLQIYYRQDNRRFTQLEILRAEMLARRVSHVLAKKRIIDLYQLNTRKENIADTLFVKLSNRQPIKLREIFKMLIDELGAILQLQGCCLFTVTPDSRAIYLDAAHPMELTYHTPGYTYTIKRHPYFAALVADPPPLRDTVTERQDPSHLLIRDPQRSPLITPALRRFAADNAISSLLFIPIRVGDGVRHVLLIFARENKQVFSDDEIELLSFFAKEIMKAAKLETLADTLHDFKNPAVGLAGIARRLRQTLEHPDLAEVRQKLIRYAEVIDREATRLQDLALTRLGEERAEPLDLGEIARRRYTLNEAVIKQQRLDRIDITPPEIHGPCPVFCPRIGLERVVDNLLGNATSFLAEQGGRLWLRVFTKDNEAVLEVGNSGEIAAERLAAIERGLVEGRGIEIIRRFATVNHGNLRITSAQGQTVFEVRLPLAREV